MVPDLAFETLLRFVPDQNPEILGRRPGIGEARVLPENEAGIIGGIAQHHAALGTDHPKLLQSACDQCMADTAALKVRMDGHRTQPEPA